MAKYGICDTTNLDGKNFSFTYTSNVENGSLVTKGALVTGSKDIYNAKIPETASLATEPVYLVAHPAWNYDTSSVINQNQEEFINKANKPFRVYELRPTRRFTVTDYSITPIDASTALAEGQYIGLVNADMKPKASATQPTGTAFIGKIIKIKEFGMNYYVGQNVDTRVKKVLIEVVKNG